MSQHLDPLRPRPKLDLCRDSLRLHPRWRLVPLARLPLERRRLLVGPDGDAELFGVLKARGDEPGARRLRLIDHDTANLLEALRRGGNVAKGTDIHPSALDLARLVVDGVLEAETPDGRISGPASLERLFELPELFPESALAARSHQALRYGERLRALAPTPLSARLYRFGRLPDSPSWRRRFRASRDRLQALGLEAGSRLQRVTDRHWQRRDHKGWWMWWPRSAHRQEEVSRPAKLYVSPRPDALGDAFRAVIETLAASRPWPVKVAGDGEGFLRPDKLVIYLPSWRRARELAADLIAAFGFLPSHGVPFTAALDQEGLVSWAPEPPKSEQTLPWLQPESWRLWLTNRFALALDAARREPPEDIPGWRFAAERLRLEGLDPQTFLPDAELWRLPPSQGVPT